MSEKESKPVMVGKEEFPTMKEAKEYLTLLRQTNPLFLKIYGNPEFR